MREPLTRGQRQAVSLDTQVRREIIQDCDN
jgi:hypothetical protein